LEEGAFATLISAVATQLAHAPALYLLHPPQSTGSACPISIGRRVKQVQDQFGPVYGIGAAAFEGSFDALLDDNEVFRVGELECKVIHLPGHTPDHIGVVVGDTVFAGDSIFLFALS
jgi:glyoxylase-like metal-dependent hydrolase (beta-lactamase superfamily II)